MHGNNNSPIGFFDSGVGGLSVYSVFKKILPNENTIYFGDLKNMPYGNKSKNELLGFARKILDFFKEQNVKAVVIACNTSSATVYDIIKDEYDFKIYPIVQSCAKVLSGLHNSSYGVFATSATINSGIYKKEIQIYKPEIKVYEMACPNWTNYVENGLTQTEECKADIKQKMSEMQKFNPDEIILGCTHYPYLLPILKEYAPIDKFIDPAEIFVNYIKSDLEEKNLLNISPASGYEKFYVSANRENFVRNAKLFYSLHELPILYQ